MTKLIISAALVALLSAPASARFDADEGGLSAYPRFTKSERTQMSQAGHLVNRPFQLR
jgi:hypothetical protein